MISRNGTGLINPVCGVPRHTVSADEMRGKPDCNDSCRVQIPADAKNDWIQAEE